MADMMVGRSVLFKTNKAESNPTETVLEVDNIVVKESRGLEAVKNLSLTLRAGETVGIAGIDGNGQSELIQAITGLKKVESGTIKLNGKDITNLPPRKITESGVGHIPEDRQRHGLILPMTLSENISLQSYYKEPFSHNFFLNEKEMDNYAVRLIQEFDVRTQSEKSTAGSLSGGNQQKAIIAREVDRDPSLLIAAQPTRGLDVGAIEFIHKRLIEHRDQGNAVLLMSFELDEILNVSDRIVVIYEGQIVAEVKQSETSEQELGLLMTGTPLEQARKELQAAKSKGGNSHE